MPAEKVQVVVIGGGATGTGIIRDLALRGISAIMVEQGDLAHGTSSRFHGLLHSGARYVVRDLESARECIKENMILRRIAPNCVEPTGGLFVQLPEDDPDYAGRWEAACAQAGITAVETEPDQLVKENNVLARNIIRAFRVPDCAVDGFRVLWGNAASARRHGARIITYTGVTAIHQSNGSITGVDLTNLLSGQVSRLECQAVINAAGAWAGLVAARAGIRVEVIKDKGTLVAFNHRLVNTVINRLRPPGDGDILVPHGAITIFGTTSATVEDPGCTDPDDREVLDLIRLGKDLVPEMESHRLLRAFAGVRPLYKRGSEAGGRTVSRSFALLDHRELDGLAGFYSIVGGKFTTFRLMAEKTVDLVARQLGVNSPCRTAEEPLTIPVTEDLISRGKRVFGAPGAGMAAERLGESFLGVVEEAERFPEKGRLICQCELVSQAEIEHAAGSEDVFNLGDIRRKTRMGMGTCQGTFCGFRTLGTLGGHPRFAGNHHMHLKNFMQKRWKGIRPVLWGQQIREAQLAVAIYGALLGMERMK